MGYKGARRCLQLVAGLIVAVGVLHLVATPHISTLLRGSPPGVYDRALGPTLLNHVLTGVLLVALGFTTWFAAGAFERDERLALRVLVANTIAALTLPLSILIFMRRSEYYSAPLFVTGVILSSVIPLLMTFATISVARMYWKVADQRKGDRAF
jgi:hypothetical protein